MAKSSKLKKNWSSRFNKPVNELVKKFTSSVNFDKKLYKHDIEGSLAHTWAWPVAQVQSILNLDGDIKMSISDQGAMMITVDSGMAKYDYILPAQSK